MLPNLLEIEALRSHHTATESEKKDPSPFRSRNQEEGAVSGLKEETQNALRALLKAQKKKEELAAQMSGMLAMPTPLSEAALAAASQELKLDASAQVSQVFEKLIRKLIAVNESGVQKTSFFIGGEASSLFRGAKITITEFSTAPKVFNVYFEANEQALSLFRDHAGNLLTHLNEGPFGFSIHRLETGLLSDKEKEPFLEAIGEEKEDEDE